MSSIPKSFSAFSGEALKPAFIEKEEKDLRTENHSKIARQQIEKSNIPLHNTRPISSGKENQNSAAEAHFNPIEKGSSEATETLEQILQKMPEEERHTFVDLSQIIEGIGNNFEKFSYSKNAIDALINKIVIREGNTEKSKLSRDNLRALQGAIYEQFRSEKSKPIESAILKVSPENRKKLLEIMKAQQHHDRNESKTNLIGLTQLRQPISVISQDRPNGDHSRSTNYALSSRPIFNRYPAQQNARNWKTYDVEEHIKINNKMSSNEDGYNCYFYKAQEIMPGIYLGSATVAQNVMEPGSSLSEDVLEKGRLKEKNLSRPAAVRCLDRDDEGDREYGFFASFFSRLFGREDKDVLLVQVRDVPNKDDAQNFRMKFEKAFAFIETQVNAGNQVLIHCRAGQSRSATLLAAYIMKKTGCTAGEALDWIAKKRPIIYPQQPFLDLLQAYEEELKKAAV